MPRTQNSHPSSDTPTESGVQLLDLLLDLSSIDGAELPLKRARRRVNALPARGPRRGRRPVPHRMPLDEAASGVPKLPEDDGAPSARELLDHSATLMAEAGIFPTREARDLDLLLVAHLVRSTVDDDGEEPVQQLATRLDLEGRDMLALAASVRRLHQLRLIQVGRRGPREQESGQELITLLHGQVRLSPRALELIFRDSLRDEVEGECRESGQDPDALEEAFRLLKPLRECMPSGPQSRSSRAQHARRALLLEAFHTHWLHLVARLQREERPFPMGELMLRCGLDAAESAVLLYVVEEALDGLGCSTLEVQALVATSTVARLGQSLLNPGGRLVREGLLGLERGPFGNASVELGEQTLAALGTAPGDALESVIESQELLSREEAGATWEQLVLPPWLARELDLIAVLGDHQLSSTLNRWGLSTAQAGGGATGRLLLFSGPSGTGKTLAARALAARLGRTLLVTDCSRIFDKYVGESEKRVRELFLVYERACKGSPLAPILLLNEADQLLGRRLEGEHSVDRMYSRLQNLLLEHFERFSGLLVATTNRPESLDEAFARRFTDKLVFPRPGQAERLQLWERHLPAGVPRLEDLALDDIATQDITGGQIALAAARAIRMAALRGDGLLREDLWEAAQRELKGAEPWQGKEMPLGFGR